MAAKNAKGGAKGGAAQKGGAKGGKGGGKPAGQPGAKGAKAEKGAARAPAKAASGPHTGAGLPTPTPRLRTHYQQVVRAKLIEKFGFTNPHQVPQLEKIVLNCGVGEAIKNAKILDSVCEELELITGQKPVRRKAKKSIANFALREGQEIGASVTLRGVRMWEFLDRFVTVSIPRIRDFRGLGTRAFDGRGNYSLGVKEQLIFPEINYDMVDAIRGMDITFVTSATRDDQALELLHQLGMPFKGTSPVLPTIV